MKPNRVKEALGSGGIPVGIGVQIASPEIVEIAGAVGYEFVFLDCEHGSFFIETAVDMVRAADSAGTTPLVRVPSQEPSCIMRMLDAGAMGVIVPNVTTRSEAEASVAAAKYKMNGNRGARGACPGTRASRHQTSNWPEFVSWSNANTMVWLLIESPDGVENIEDIVTVPGVDAIMLGPFDLAHAMGLPGQTRHPEVVQSCMRVIAAAKNARVDVVATLFSATPNEMRVEKQRWIDVGARILVVGSDRRIIVTALRERGAALRE